MMNDSLQRIVFLDIDGPIINTPMFYLDPGASMLRAALNTQAIAYVKRLCKIANARLVTNSSHNYAVVDDPLTGAVRNLRQDLVTWGMPPDLFHVDWRTEYPNPSGATDTTRRLKAIQNWQDANGEADWVCFDDENFTNDKRLIRIDFDAGIDYAAYRKASKVWGFRKDPLWAGF
jgi:hypothetical protein